MIKRFRRLFYKLTGGRPMAFQHHYFEDEVSRKVVSVYKDKLGNQYLADNGPWSWFRVKTEPDRTLVMPSSIFSHFNEMMHVIDEAAPIPDFVWDDLLAEFNQLPTIKSKDAPIPKKRSHLRLIKGGLR